MKVLLLLCLLLPTTLLAQNITGKVTNQKDEPLVGASVYWKGTKVGTVTNSKGDFDITTEGSGNKMLIARYVGHKTDTLRITDQSVVNFSLEESQTLDEVVVKGKQDGVIISSSKAIKTEQLTQAELRKSACCDLAGCFETQTTIQPQTTNVITNAKELRILGLSGVYNQVLIDGYPMIQGLTYTYGISSVPGTVVENIYVAKGSNSVLQGFENISGQINVITKDPADTDKLYLNAYINNFLEKHINAIYAVKSGDWSNLTALHTVQPADEFDRDNDNFLDLPKLTRYMVFNKLKYGDDTKTGFNTSINLRFVNEQRVGGQTNYNEETDKGSTDVYGQTVNINQPEISTKTGYRIDEMHNFALFASGFYQNQESYFGTIKYDARQTNMYGNLQYELDYDNTSLKTGVSFRYLNLEEDLSFTDNTLQRTYAGNYLKDEQIAGVFAENTLMLFDDKLTWIAGVRADNHNRFGTILTPRTLLKYNLTENSVIRANIGTGWRTVNLFSENIGLLVSSRDIVITEDLKPEEALNIGINFTQNFENDDFNGFFSADFYHTDFQNQIFPDYDTDPTKAIIENFTGTSISNTFQAEVYLNMWDQFEFKTGYSFLDVYREVNDKKVLLPFNPRHKIVTTLGYNPPSGDYQIDMNIHWYGEQRLPNTQSNPEQYQRPDFSEDYMLVNAQFTYNLDQVELYAGAENIFNFRQNRPIIGWQDPFGEFFDTSSVWGPTRGRELYVGIRYKIPGN